LRPVSAVSAAVENEFDVLGDQDTVFLHAGFYLDYGAMARISRREFFGVIDHQLNRSTARLREGITDGNIVAVAFAAEISTDITWMNN
jgi:hypothetical protein